MHRHGRTANDIKAEAVESTIKISKFDSVGLKFSRTYSLDLIY
jgi:hypothetical protein